MRKEDWDPENVVKIRILSPFEFPVDWKKKERKRAAPEGQKGSFTPTSYFLGLGTKVATVPLVKQVPGIIVQIHGGGFIAMSSATSRHHTI